MLKRRKKEIPIVKQKPWLIISYTSVQNKGMDDEFDAGYLEFNHRETGISFLKEMAWLKGEGPYAIKDYKPPTLLNIWDILKNNTPGTTGIVYKNWHVKRDQGCFINLLVDPLCDPPVVISKDMISDFVSKKQDFASFIEMLDNMQEEKEAERIKEKSQILNLDEMRLQRQG